VRARTRFFECTVRSCLGHSNGNIAIDLRTCWIRVACYYSDFEMPGTYLFIHSRTRVIRKILGSKPLKSEIRLPAIAVVSAKYIVRAPPARFHVGLTSGKPGVDTHTLSPCPRNRDWLETNSWYSVNVRTNLTICFVGG